MDGSGKCPLEHPEECMKYSWLPTLLIIGFDEFLHSVGATIQSDDKPISDTAEGK